ncbi:Cro/Cl family transcriptional regulator [Ligilactobacillus salitolerans]|uniref:Cro/Cl family transcriptional regulator n=1 Tax=Ligilactobacillus salitolerans TaxID=1808352 RepID=A0A401ISM5_9LACO|nr:helix-turn-helix transcriptional regulator [Ligilactobacillus salitolerans]GBG94521.1 Cro/Cl family transcriptional regulator [Ligilactobacillus salitolerans]
MFPVRLRALRQGRGLSLPALAKELNKEADQPADRRNTGHQIGSWERGVNRPSYVEVVKLAEYFNVSLDFLMGRDYDDFEIEDLFASNSRLRFNGKTLDTEDRNAVYGMIKGYLRAKYPPKDEEQKDSAQVTLPLDQ